jgi:hypothetical protein
VFHGLVKSRSTDSARLLFVDRIGSNWWIVQRDKEGNEDEAQRTVSPQSVVRLAPSLASVDGMRYSRHA